MEIEIDALVVSHEPSWTSSPTGSVSESSPFPKTTDIEKKPTGSFCFVFIDTIWTMFSGL